MFTLGILLFFFAIVHSYAPCENIPHLFDADDGDAPTSDFNCCTMGYALQYQSLYSERSLSQFLAYWGRAVVYHDLVYMPVNESITTSECFGEYTHQSTCNRATPRIDASIVYGNTVAEENELREGLDKCEMKTLSHHALPRVCDLDIIEKVFSPLGSEHDVRCAGDPRNSESPNILVIHMLLVAEHNRICSESSSLSAGDMFNVAKDHVVALVQKITMEEWLPALVGASRIPAFEGTKGNVWNVTREFAVTIESVMTSISSDRIIFIDGDAETYKVDQYDGYYKSDVVNVREGGMCALLTGFLQDPLYKVYYHKSDVNLDNYVSMKQCLLSRELGTLSFNATLVGYGLPHVNTLRDITSDEHLVDFMHNVFDTSNEVYIAANMELYMGVLIENHGPLDGDIIGPLTREIILQQLLSWRDNDPYYYENYASLKHRVHNRGFVSLMKKHCSGLMKLIEPMDATSVWEVSQSRLYGKVAEPVEHTTSNMVLVGLVIILSFFLIAGVVCITRNVKMTGGKTK